jgi:hypothetical protein
VPFQLLHVGGLGQERTPTVLFRAMAKMASLGEISPKNFELRLIGNVQPSVLASATAEGVMPFIRTESYMPHRDALEATFRADVLLLLITQSAKNRRILPGKTFEYLRTRRPILALGPPEGEVDQILAEVGAGSVIRYDDEAAVLTRLRSWLRPGSSEPSVTRMTEVQRFSREALTKRLAELLEEVCR